MKILPITILLSIILTIFPVAADNKTKKTNTDPTVVLVKDGVRQTIPFSKTEKINPDSIESVSVNNDTLFIKIKSVKKSALKRNKIKK